MPTNLIMVIYEDVHTGGTAGSSPSFRLEDSCWAPAERLLGNVPVGKANARVTTTNINKTYNSIRQYKTIRREN